MRYRIAKIGVTYYSNAAYLGSTVFTAESKIKYFIIVSKQNIIARTLQVGSDWWKFSGGSRFFTALSVIMVCVFIWFHSFALFIIPLSEAKVSRRITNPQER